MNSPFSNFYNAQTHFRLLNNDCLLEQLMEYTRPPQASKVPQERKAYRLKDKNKGRGSSFRYPPPLKFHTSLTYIKLVRNLDSIFNTMILR